MKERLTGAIILVALIVVLVPELLTGPIRPAVRVHGPGSSAEEPPLRSYTINLADEAHGGSGAAQPQPSPGTAAPMAPVAEPAEAPPARPATLSAALPPAATAQPAAPAPSQATATSAHKPPPASPAPQAGSAGGWVVQLGSFANRSNAERLSQQVRALGYPVSVSRGTTGRRLYRVQAGPTHERAAAEQMAAKLAAQGHAGSVNPK